MYSFAYWCNSSECFFLITCSSGFGVVAGSPSKARQICGTKHWSCAIALSLHLVTKWYCTRCWVCSYIGHKPTRANNMSWEFGWHGPPNKQRFYPSRRSTGIMLGYIIFPQSFLIRSMGRAGRVTIVTWAFFLYDIVLVTNSRWASEPRCLPLYFL